MTFAPKGNRVFDELTVIENLEIGGFQLPREELPGRIEEVFELFPVLKQRSCEEAGRPSGGQKQMLALGRALAPQPKLLLLDEPSLGLGPGLVRSVFARLEEIRAALSCSGARIAAAPTCPRRLRIAHVAGSGSRTTLGPWLLLPLWPDDQQGSDDDAAAQIQRGDVSGRGCVSGGA
jgi:hypothetical protein